jgi:hypothetical protein
MAIINLTANLVRTAACPNGKGKVDFFDAGCKGLQLEVRAGGGKTWYLRYTNLRGKQRQLRIADALDLSLEQARKRADRLGDGRKPWEARPLSSLAVVTSAVPNAWRGRPVLPPVKRRTRRLKRGNHFLRLKVHTFTST